MFLWFQGVISCGIKSKLFYFSFPSRVFQLYFTGFLKVYETVFSLKKYLTSKIEKKFHLSFFAILWTPWSWKEKSEVYLTCINFWTFHDDLKACPEVIRLPIWPKNMKFSVKIQFFMYLTPRKTCFWINDKFEIVFLKLDLEVITFPQNL